MSAVHTSFSVIEELCASGKGSEALKEDRLVMTGDFVAVVDGATSSGPIGDRSGGIVAAETVEASLRSLPPEATAHEFATSATAALAKAIGSRADNSVMLPSAAVVVWSRHRGEIWRIGDCHFRIDRTAFPGEKEIDRVSYAFRCAVLKGRLRLGQTTVEAERRVPTLKQPFMDLIRVQHAFANLDSDDPLAYGVLCGLPVPDRFIEVHSTAGACEIVLSSDGFLSPAATLDAGLAEIANVRENDPLMIDLFTGSRPFPPGCLYFDDTTYVRFAPA